MRPALAAPRRGRLRRARLLNASREDLRTLGGALFDSTAKQAVWWVLQAVRWALMPIVVKETSRPTRSHCHVGPTVLGPHVSGTSPSQHL